MISLVDTTGGDINYLFCENEEKENFSGNIALIMLYIQQMLFAVDYLHWTKDILHLDIKGRYSVNKLAKIWLCVIFSLNQLAIFC